MSPTRSPTAGILNHHPDLVARLEELEMRLAGYQALEEGLRAGVSVNSALADFDSRMNRLPTKQPRSPDSVDDSVPTSSHRLVHRRPRSPQDGDQGLYCLSKPYEDESTLGTLSPRPAARLPKKRTATALGSDDDCSPRKHRQPRLVDLSGDAHQQSSTLEDVEQSVGDIHVEMKSDVLATKDMQTSDLDLHVPECTPLVITVANNSVIISSVGRPTQLTSPSESCTSPVPPASDGCASNVTPDILNHSSETSSAFCVISSRSEQSEHSYGKNEGCSHGDPDGVNYMTVADPDPSKLANNMPGGDDLSMDSDVTGDLAMEAVDAISAPSCSTDGSLAENSVPGPASSVHSTDEADSDYYVDPPSGESEDMSKGRRSVHCDSRVRALSAQPSGLSNSLADTIADTNDVGGPNTKDSKPSGPVTSKRSLPDSSRPVKARRERETLVAKCTEPQPGQTRYWTEEEHIRFLEAVARYGEKAYVAISNHVETRTPKQVRTHAQKFQMKMARLAKCGAVIPGGALPSHSRGSSKASKARAAATAKAIAKNSNTIAVCDDSTGTLPTVAPVPKSRNSSHPSTVAARTTSSLSKSGEAFLPRSLPMGSTIPRGLAVEYTTPDHDLGEYTGSSSSSGVGETMEKAAVDAVDYSFDVSPAAELEAMEASIGDISSLLGTDEESGVSLLIGRTGENSGAIGSLSNEYFSFIGGETAASGREANKMYAQDLEDLEDVRALSTSPFSNPAEEWLLA